LPFAPWYTIAEVRRAVIAGLILSSFALAQKPLAKFIEGAIGDNSPAPHHCDHFICLYFANEIISKIEHHVACADNGTAFSQMEFLLVKRRKFVVSQNNRLGMIFAAKEYRPCCEKCRTMMY